ncbi:MAG: sortase, partial [Anaerovoracaceae bacterium]
MKRKSVLTIIAILILIVGVTVALYPHILRWKYEKETKSRTEDFVQEVRSQNKSQGQEGDKTASWVDLDGLYQEMVNYNQTLYREGQSSLVDAWSYQQESFDLSKWGVKEPSIGYIDLPTMEVRLPIYLGATRKNMELGATHLSQTSMPIGGKNTNSVIAAHRGYYGAKMF